MPAGHEMLVDFVRDRVADAEQEGRQLAADRPRQQQAEDRVLGHVGALAQDRVPGAESGAEVWDRREREDHRRPGENG
jgi:hypothetical protein